MPCEVVRAYSLLFNTKGSLLHIQLSCTEAPNRSVLSVVSFIAFLCTTISEP